MWSERLILILVSSENQGFVLGACGYLKLIIYMRIYEYQAQYSYYM